MAEFDAQVRRIQAMERAMEVSNDAADVAEEALEQLEEAFAQYAKLSEYYSDQAWFADKEALERGDFDPAPQAGVLSEDLPYDALGRWHELALDMLELSAKILRA